MNNGKVNKREIICSNPLVKFYLKEYTDGSVTESGYSGFGYIAYQL